VSNATLFEKVWLDHVVVDETPDTPAVLYIDLHIIHEVTTPQAFTVLREQGLPVRRPDLTLPTMDHSTPTTPVSSFKDLAVVGESAANQIRQMEQNCKDFDLDLIGFGNEHRGIVHVIGPELGATQPGKTIVCGDSHSSTHGAFGALAFGIGTTEVGHVLATQCLLQRKPKTLAINIDGQIPAGVSAKDVILTIIGEIGVDGGTGHVIEYRGDAITALDMESRMTICNMSIEGGARAGMIGGRSCAPTKAPSSTSPSRSLPVRCNPWSPSARIRAWSSGSTNLCPMAAMTRASAKRSTTCRSIPATR
jgi:3-isopropylmalate/(R)-2-methylmalate dehydratase large subunit